MLDNGAQLLALTLSQLFAIIDQVIVKIRWQNNSSGCYRPRKATAASLVTTGLDSSRYQILLKHLSVTYP